MKHVVAFDYRLALERGRAREVRYWEVVLLKALQQEGRNLSIEDIALLAGVSPSSVRRIVKRYSRLGAEHLVPVSLARPATGRKAALSSNQIERLSKILSSGVQLDGRHWTAAAVQGVIRRHFKTKVSRSTAWRYLRQVVAGEQPSLFL